MSTRQARVELESAGEFLVNANTALAKGLARLEMLDALNGEAGAYLVEARAQLTKAMVQADRVCVELNEKGNAAPNEQLS